MKLPFSQTANLVLAAALLVQCTYAQEVHNPTIREEVHEKGSASRSVFSDSFVRDPYGFEYIVRQSEFIVEGQVVSQESHLTPDEQSVFTDNGFEVYDVFKTTGASVSAPQKIAIITAGGEMTVDGGKVKVTSSMTPLKLGGWYILLLVKSKQGDTFFIPADALGAFGVNQGNSTVECNLKGHLLDLPCPGTLAEFLNALNKELKSTNPPR